jgi:hypothetical protein
MFVHEDTRKSAFYKVTYVAKKRLCVLGVHACEDEKLYQNFMMRCAGRTGGRTCWF